MASDRRAWLCRTRRQKYSTVMFFTLTCIQVGCMAAQPWGCPALQGSLCGLVRQSAVTSGPEPMRGPDLCDHHTCWRGVTRGLPSAAGVEHDSPSSSAMRMCWEGSVAGSRVNSVRIVAARRSTPCDHLDDVAAAAMPMHPPHLVTRNHCRAGVVIWCGVFQWGIGWCPPPPSSPFLTVPLPMIFSLVSKSTRECKSASLPQRPSVARQLGLQPFPCRRLTLLSA